MFHAATLSQIGPSMAQLRPNGGGRVASIIVFPENQALEDIGCVLHWFSKLALDVR
jgi:hypothetical protein